MSSELVLNRNSGMIGPIALGDLQPVELRQALRRLQVGSVSDPTRFGEWYVLLRLEQLLPAVLDSSTSQMLLQHELDIWIKERCLSLIEGAAVDPLDYHPTHDGISAP